MKYGKKIVSILSIVGLVCALSTNARAGEGFYLGGAFGKAYLDENIGGIQIDADSSTYRFFGGYSFTRHFAVEVGYLDLGTFRDTIDVAGTPVPVSVSADGFTLAGVGTIPISEKFSVSGRLGAFFLDGKATVGGITENDPSEANALVGIGLAYSLNEKVDLNLGVDYIDTKDADPTVASLGLTIRF
jgi:OOP family OmpA-OmpF porin